MIKQGTIDERERRVLDSALRNLGYEPADFSVEIGEVASDPKERSLPRGTLRGRKEIITTRISSGDTFRQEQYVDDAWAGEVLQALIQGDLGPTV